MQYKSECISIHSAVSRNFLKCETCPNWAVTHVGLIRLARRNRCHGILAEPAQDYGIGIYSVEEIGTIPMHYERAPVLQQEGMGGEACGGFAPAPPGFNALVPLPIGGFCKHTAKGGCRSIPLHRSRPLSRSSGCFPVWGHGTWAKRGRNLGHNAGQRTKGTGRVCSGAQIRARFSSVAPGYVIKTVVTPATAR